MTHLLQMDRDCLVRFARRARQLFDHMLLRRLRFSIIYILTLLARCWALLLALPTTMAPTPTRRYVINESRTLVLSVGDITRFVGDVIVNAGE